MTKLRLHNALLFLPLAVVVITACLFVATPKSAHAAPSDTPCLHSIKGGLPILLPDPTNPVEVGYAEQDIYGVANVYVHLYRFTDRSYPDCHEFKAHFDIFVWANNPRLVVQFYDEPDMQGPTPTFYRYTPGGFSSGWYHIDSPIDFVVNCDGAKAVLVDVLSGKHILESGAPDTGTVCS